MTDQRWAIDIDRDTIADARIVEEPQADLPEGAIEVKLDLYAMTANNVKIIHANAVASRELEWQVSSRRIKRLGQQVPRIVM